MENVTTKLIIDTSEASVSVKAITDDLSKLQTEVVDTNKTIVKSFDTSEQSVKEFTTQVDKSEKEMQDYDDIVKMSAGAFSKLSTEVGKAERELHDLIAAQIAGEKISKKELETATKNVTALRHKREEVDRISKSYLGANKAQDKFTSTSAKVNSQLSGMSGSMLGMIGLGMGIEGGLQFAMQGVDAYLKQAEAQKRLLVSLNNQEDIQKRLIENANLLKDAYLFDDDVINQGQAFLAGQGRTEEQIMKVTKAAAGMSRALGIDYNEAVEMLDATLEGNRGRLGKWAKDVKGLSDAQLMNGEAVDIMRQKYDDLGLAFSDTKLGQIQKAKMTFSDLQKSIGELVVSIPGLDIALSGLRGYYGDIINIVGGLSGTPERIGKALQSLMSLATGPLGVLNRMLKELTGIDIFVWLRKSTQGVGEFYQSLVGANSWVGKIVESFWDLQNTGPGISDVFSQVGNSISTNLAPAITTVTDGFNTLEEQIKSMRTVYSDVGVKYQDLVAQWEALEAERILQEEAGFKLTKQQQAEIIEIEKNAAVYKKLLEAVKKASDAKFGLTIVTEKHTEAVKEETEAIKAASHYADLQKQLSDTETNLRNLLTVMQNPDLFPADKVAEFTALYEAQLLRYFDLTKELEAINEQYKLITTNADLAIEPVEQVAHLGIASTRKWYEELFKLRILVGGTTRTFSEAWDEWLQKADVQKTKEMFGELLNNFAQFSSGLNALRQESINKLLEANQKETDALKTKEQKQEELAKAGYANNLRATKEALSKLERERAGYLRRQEELQKKERLLTQAAAAVDMAGATAKIIKTYAATPVLAGILIASQLALFALTIAKSRVASKKLGSGGMLDGKSHSQGGIFIPQLNTEVEGGEYVINRKSTKKWMPLIEAINKDQKWLTGINFKERDVKINVNFEDSKNLAETNKLLRAAQRDRQWEENGYIVTKRGVVITKIKK
jgi:hypothetical protein